MKPLMRGIDISSHQGSINWDKVKDQVDFAIIRAGFGKNNVDKYARKNAEECTNRGIPFGFYWFSYALTVEQARNEAKYLLSLAKDYKPLFPLYFDFEYDSVRYAKEKGVNVTPKLLNKMTVAFCEEIENAGYYAGVYANNDYVVNMYSEDIFNTYDLWYAMWGNTSPGRSVNLWQFTDSGKVKGISGNVDFNYAYIDYPKLIKSKGLNGYKEPPQFVCPMGCPHCPHSGGGK